MIVERKLLNKIKDMGLNSYESKVWVALLSRGISTAGELSDIANVPRSRSYDVLESLEKKGFVIMKLGKPIKYVAVSPTEAIERVKKAIRKKALEDEEIFDELKDSDVMNELVHLHENGLEMQDPTELTGSIRGQDNIYNHLIHQIKTAKENILLSTTEEGLIRKTKVLTKHLKKAKARGVSINVCAPLTVQNKKQAETLSNMVNLTNTTKDMRFCIIDNNQMTIMLTKDSKVHPSYDLAVWLHTPYFAKTLKSVVE